MQLAPLFSLLLVLLLASCARAQETPARLRTGHPALDDKLAGLIAADSLAISARQARSLDGAVFLDARENNEYAISHLPGALPLGYRQPDYGVLAGVPKNRPLVVYCTVGYRSERMARDLRQRGYRRVYNLYGSLYAWRLAGFPLEDANGKPTKRLHTYNRKWSTLVPDSIGEKVY